ncbi:hypothetical protein DL93DRAFT_2173929 [Clavulina sp. PMI_390]|nr:hypothetical protein DL93DRAFT_2174034 [Clavulina sp. PMI_390]KAF8294850.1 hypothetical protein DL93DRAFT_2173929 [Clavulina sp. PMI_390]
MTTANGAAASSSRTVTGGNQLTNENIPAAALTASVRARISALGSAVGARSRAVFLCVFIKPKH